MTAGTTTATALLRGQGVLRHRLVGVLLAVVLLAGGGLRADAATDRGHYASADALAYSGLGAALATSGRFAVPGMHEPWRWSPGLPIAFALAQRALGTGGRDAVQADFAVEVLAGSATVLAVFALVALTAGAVPALLAAGAVALYPPLVRAGGELLTEPLGGLLLVCALLAAAHAARNGRRWAWLGAGALLGLTVLVRGDLVLLPPLLAAAAAVLLRRGGARRRTAALAGGLLLLGALLPAGGWSAYASTRSGTFVPVTSGGSSNLFIGTFLPGGGTLYGVKRELAPEVRRRFPALHAVRTANIPQRWVVSTVAARHPGLSRDAALRLEADHNLRAYALAQPIAFAGLLARKAGRLWLHPTVGAHHRVRPWVLVLHLALLALAAAGLLAGLAVAAPRAGRTVLWLGTATLAYVTAVNAVFVAEPRHNLVVMPLLVALGAAGAALSARPRSRTSRRRSPGTSAPPG